MATAYPYTDYVKMLGSEDGSTFSWTSVTDFENTLNAVDQNADGDLDMHGDYFSNAIVSFSGYYFTASNGETFAVYQSTNNPGSFFVPYSKADFDLFADLPSSGSMADKADNFLPTGNPVCFGAGSLIATLQGETAVEDFVIGDVIVTATGAAVAIKWIGCQTVDKRLCGPKMEPVRIRAGALGQGLPHSDLIVTADHGMILDNLVINASALVNGTTIAFVPLSELPTQVTYYHIETEAHDVILANGAASETFVDAVGRAAFDNYREYVALYGAERIIPEMERPRIPSHRMVPCAIKARLGGADTTMDFALPLGA